MLIPHSTKTALVINDKTLGGTDKLLIEIRKTLEQIQADNSTLIRTETKVQPDCIWYTLQSEFTGYKRTRLNIRNTILYIKVWKPRSKEEKLSVKIHEKTKTVVLKNYQKLIEHTFKKIDGFMDAVEKEMLKTPSNWEEQVESELYGMCCKFYYQNRIFNEQCRIHKKRFNALVLQNIISEKEENPDKYYNENGILLYDYWRRWKVEELTNVFVEYVINETENKKSTTETEMYDNISFEYTLFKNPFTMQMTDIVSKIRTRDDPFQTDYDITQRYGSD